MNIYEKIFARLEELHMSQIELSRRTGIATSTISDWRKKKINPQADKLMSICKALDMSLAELLCDEEVVERTICAGVCDAQRQCGIPHDGASDADGSVSRRREVRVLDAPELRGERRYNGHSARRHGIYRHCAGF